MKNENIIKKITISIAGVDIDVTPEQANNLYDALGSLLGLDKSPVVIKEYVPYQPYTWPYSQPFWYSSGTAGIPTDPHKYTINYNTTTGDVKLNV